MKPLLVPGQPEYMSNEWYQYITDLNNNAGMSGPRHSIWGEASVSSHGLLLPASGAPTDQLLAAVTYVKGFGAASTNTAYGQVTIPQNALKGGGVIPFVRWYPSNTDTGDCYWRISYTFTCKGTAFPTATTENIQVAAGGTADVPQTDLFTAITSPHSGSSHFGPGDQFLFGFQRRGADAADTFTGVAGLLSVGLIYRVASPGVQDKTTF